MNDTEKTKRVATILRYIARIWTVLMIVLFVAMQLTPDPNTGGYAPADMPEDLILALTFPGLLLVGFALTWWQERLGGWLMLVAYPLFLLAVILLKRAGDEFWSPGLLIIALIFMLPGILFLTASYLEGREEPAGPGGAPGIRPT